MTTYTKQQLEDMNFKREEAEKALDDRLWIDPAFAWVKSPQGGAYWTTAFEGYNPSGWQDEIRAMIAAWDGEKTKKKASDEWRGHASDLRRISAMLNHRPTLGVKRHQERLEELAVEFEDDADEYELEEGQ